MIQFDRSGAVFVAYLDDGENRMNQAWLDAISAVLDEVDAAPPPKALVTTGTRGGSTRTGSTSTG